MSSVCYKSLKDSLLKNYIRIHMLLEISQLEIPKVLALLGRLRTSDRQGCAFGSDTLEPVLRNRVWATTSLYDHINLNTENTIFEVLFHKAELFAQHSVKLLRDVV